MLRHHHAPPLPLPLPLNHPSYFKYPELSLRHPDLALKYPDLALKYPDLAHYDDVDHLLTELEQEKRHRDAIEWSNAELERSVAELETYYRDLHADSRDPDDNEWKVRFESQTELNKQLNEQREWLESELMEMRRKLTIGAYPEAKKYNLDSLNEPELLRLVKHLERTRNGLYSSMRDMEWKLDKEAKEFRHFDEIRRNVRSDLKQVNHTLERMQWSRVVEPGMISDIYPSGYYPHWLRDTPPLIHGSRSLGYPGRGGKAKGGRGAVGVGRADVSPQRSKSRAEKKGKKKQLQDNSPQGVRGGGGDEDQDGVGVNGGRRNGNSEETDNGGDLFDGGKESNVSSGADTYIKEQESKPKRKVSKERSIQQE
jgi:hypothetical protein